MDARQNASMTELVFFRYEMTAQDQTLGFELRQDDFDGFLGQGETDRQGR